MMEINDNKFFVEEGDVVPIEDDKCPNTEYTQMKYFFGLWMDDDGNDYPIHSNFEAIGKCYCVKDWKHT